MSDLAVAREHLERVGAELAGVRSALERCVADAGDVASRDAARNELRCVEAAHAMLNELRGRLERGQHG